VALPLPWEGSRVVVNDPGTSVHGDGSDPAVTEEIRRSVDRLFKKMNPEDVSPLAVFLCSDRACIITG